MAPISMIETAAFKELAVEVLQSGKSLRFQAHGISMYPFIRHGDLVEVEPIGHKEIQRGEIVLCVLENGRLVAHRVVQTIVLQEGNYFLVQGDRFRQPDGRVPQQDVLGRVVAITRHGTRRDLHSFGYLLLGWLWMSFSPLGQWLLARLSALKAFLARQLPRIIPIMAVLLWGISSLRIVSLNYR